MKLPWKKTFKWFGKEFTISITKITSWKEQIAHFLIHAILSGLLAPYFSIGVAIGLEVRDGEHGGEGFNIFPDLFFRLLGVFIGYLARIISEI